MQEEEIDITKLKYVLYARKSSIDKERQVRSIPDQIRECKHLALNKQIKVVRIIRETKSAKTPNLRPKFTQMLKDIKMGVYNGILSWNPDRLARNMLEGGQIINLIDEGILKDIKCVTHYFTNDANGKMLLGMAFVLSKQYSDNLSQGVRRGVRGRFNEDALTPTPKHGYKNEDGRYEPDGKYFDVIKEAWKMRLENKSYKEIGEYLENQKYGRKVKRSGKIIKKGWKNLTDMFHDPFYMGITIQAGSEQDLRQAYGFIPMVTEDEYNQVQALSYRRLTPYNTHKRFTYYPFRGLVQCSYCGHNMVAGASSGHTKKYMYFRCDNPDCKRPKKSIRAKVLVDWLYEFFKTNFKLTKTDYEAYETRLGQLTDQKRITVRKEARSYEGYLKVVKQDIQQTAYGIAKLPEESRAYKENSLKLDKLEAEESKLENKIKGLRAQLIDPDKEKLTLDQFLNLVKKAVTIIKSADAIKKDAICRLIFLNFSLDSEKVASYRLKEPFETMLKTRLSLSSRDART